MEGAVSSGGADIREWGAPANGVTDAGPAINACLTAETDCLIPISAAGFFIATNIVVPQNEWLEGISPNSQNSATSFLPSGTSLLTCSRGLTGACVSWGTAGQTGSGGVRNLVINGAAGTPSSGQKGLVFLGGYNITVSNVSISNFDTCLEFDQGIGAMNTNLFMQSCKTHYLVLNTWPELSLSHFRFGANGGTGNYDTASDYVLFTSSLGSGGGGSGPNSVEIDHGNFQNDSVACLFNWAGYTKTPGATGLFYIDHLGAEDDVSGMSVFCSDGTPATHGGIGSVDMGSSWVDSTSGATGSLTGGMNATDELVHWDVHDNSFDTAASTIAPTGANPGFAGAWFTNNYFQNAVTFTPGGTFRQDILTNEGNIFNQGHTLNNGSYGWYSLIDINPYGAPTNNTDNFNVIIGSPQGGLSTGFKTVSLLPSCATNIKGNAYTVSDATSPVLGNAVSGGGSVMATVKCNGTSWIVQ